MRVRIYRPQNLDDAAHTLEGLGFERDEERSNDVSINMIDRDRNIILFLDDISDGPRSYDLFHQWPEEVELILNIEFPASQDL